MVVQCRQNHAVNIDVVGCKLKVGLAIMVLGEVTVKSSVTLGSVLQKIVSGSFAGSSRHRRAKRC
jgi:hypothetical protein